MLAFIKALTVIFLIYFISFGVYMFFHGNDESLSNKDNGRKGGSSNETKMLQEMEENKKDNASAYPFDKDLHTYNIGKSDYAKHGNMQPWDIWEEYKLNPWDADVIKRILRDKGARKEDYQKIIHICLKRIEQIDKGLDL